MSVVIGGILIVGVVSSIIMISAICLCTNSNPIERRLEDQEQLEYIRNYNSRK